MPILRSCLQIQPLPTCKQVQEKSKIWTSPNGEIVSEIKVYFYRKSLESLQKRVKFDGNPLNSTAIIHLVNKYWDFEEVENDEKVKIGKFVPHFKDLTTDGNIGDADIRVHFKSWSMFF